MPPPAPGSLVKIDAYDVLGRPPDPLQISPQIPPRRRSPQNPSYVYGFRSRRQVFTDGSAFADEDFLRVPSYYQVS